MGTTLGRYELITEIGQGGMADVHLALHADADGIERLVVLKLLREDLAQDPAFVEMFRAEAKLSLLLDHPYIVKVFELGEAAGRHYIAMEYLEGEPLLGVLDKAFAGKRLDPLSYVRIAANIAEALAAAHDLTDADGKPLGVVHHDVSLGNIFVRYSGQPKLLDFGVAKASQTAAQQAQTFGKLAYMAPEKLPEPRRAGDAVPRPDDRPGDRRSDIWSLGCVLWEALTYKRLFKGATDVELIREVRYVNVPPPSTVNPDVPKELDPIVLRALQRDPTRRYQTANELAGALEAVLAAQGYPAKNFKIAAYMMATFADNMAARERLIREVTSDGRPSAEVIDAAFGEPSAPKRESLPSFEALLESKPTVLPAGHTGADVMAPLVSERATERTTELTDDDLRARLPVTPVPRRGAAAALDEADAPAWIAAQRRRQLVRYAALGGGALLLVVIIAAATCRGDAKHAPAVANDRPPETLPAARPAPVAVPDEPAPVRAPAPVPGDAAVAAAPEIEMPPEPAEPPATAPADGKPVPDDNPAHKARPKAEAGKLYARGLAAYNKKQLDKAYGYFTEGRRANPRYAPNWYGIGMVHEKRGRKHDAKVAYQRYLALDPKAKNAKALREHIANKL